MAFRIPEVDEPPEIQKEQHSRFEIKDDDDDEDPE